MVVNDRASIVGLAIASLGRALAELSPDAAAPTEATPLLADGSDLDSLGLVMFVVDLEQSLRAAGVDFALAEALVLPHDKNPFGTVGSLVDHIHARVIGRPPPGI